MSAGELGQKKVSPAWVILIGNEKGGAGKTTVAVHLATALLHEGARVAIVDLDTRQQSTGHFFANRAAWNAAQGAGLPLPCQVVPVRDDEGLRAALATAADFIVVDTPGADTELSRSAHAFADLIVTPMNDSFVDFDMLGVIDPVTLEVLRPSLYAETVWEARKAKAIRASGPSTGWSCATGWRRWRRATGAGWTNAWPHCRAGWDFGPLPVCATGSSIASCFPSA